MILFSYDIVMRDQSMGQPLMRGSLYVRAWKARGGMRRRRECRAYLNNRPNFK
jgi:hypothetical protein